MWRPRESDPIRNTCFTVSPSRLTISPGSPGRRSRLAASNSDGSTVPSRGAAMAMKLRTRSTAPPIRTEALPRMVLIADPGIEEHVRQVDQQIHHDVHEGEEQDHPL